MKTWIASIAFAVAVCLIAAPVRLIAQHGATTNTQSGGGDEGNGEGGAFACDLCHNDSGSAGGPFGPTWDGHGFWGIGCGDQYYPCMDCHDFNACHVPFQNNGKCDKWHWTCSHHEEAFSRIRKAVQVGDVPLLFAMAKSGSKFVNWLPSGYLVVRNCTGSIIGAIHAPVPVENRRGTARALASL